MAKPLRTILAEYFTLLDAGTEPTLEYFYARANAEGFSRDLVDQELAALHDSGLLVRDRRQELKPARRVLTP